MSSRPPRHPEDQDAAESPDLDDFEALDQFCSEVDIEEISFEMWRDKHSSLDLIYHLSLTADEMRDGCEKAIIFSRTFRESADINDRPRRMKTEFTVQVPPKSHHGLELVVKGQGDASTQVVGDLRVIIQLI